jgi:TorA-specific chaperone
MSEDAACNAMLAEWLAGIFSAPLSEAAVVAYRAAPGGFLQSLAAEPAAAWGAAHMLQALKADASPALATRHLSARFTRLFSGVARNTTVSLYESAYHGASGRLFQQPVGDMHRLLTLVNLTVAPPSCEPPDHIAFELSLLAACYRAEESPCVMELLLNRLALWVPAFAAACRDADGGGFYAGAAALLAWFIASLRQTGRDPAPIHARSAGALQ